MIEMWEFFQKLKKPFINWLAKRLPDCKSLTPIFSESLDRRPILREKIVMRLHLLTCSACKNYISNLKFMREVFHEQEKRLEEDKFSISLSPEARERIKNSLNSTQS